ncbi:MAG: hypothetical protein EXS08_09095 [Planctomycetes bacterium]|nr:hypothetical protein [Planctomycetota bacterium]
MKLLALVVGGLLFVAGLLYLVGSFVPREHRAACRSTFAASPETLFALLADVEGSVAWRHELKSVRVLEPLDGKPSFVEESSQGSVRYVIECDEPPHTRVLRIADDELPYGGTWTFELSPSANGTTLTLTEDGFVKPPIFRALAHFVFGYHSTMEGYLSNVAKKLGERVTVERGQ